MAPTQWLADLPLQKGKNLCQHGRRPLLPLHLRQRRLRLGQPERHVHGAVEVDGGGQGGAGLLPTTGLVVQPAQPEVVVGHERAHAECLGQGQGLLVVGFGLRGIGWVGVGPDDAKLVQRERLAVAFLLLPSQVERLARMLPGLLAASRQAIDLAEPRVGMTSQRAHADTFAEHLLQQRAPLREAPLERRGVAQAPRDRWQHIPVAGGTTEGQARLQHPDGLLQLPLGEVQVAEAAVDNARCDPSALQRGEASASSPWRLPSTNAPSAPKVRASHARDWIRTSVLGLPDSRSVAATFRRSSSAARPKSPMA
jgi:hypothetical protein